MAGLIIHPVAASQTPGNIIFSQVGHYKVTFAPVIQPTDTRICQNNPSVINANMPPLTGPAVLVDGRMCANFVTIDESPVVFALIGYNSESIGNSDPANTTIQRFFPTLNISYNAQSLGSFAPVNSSVPLGNNQAMSQYTNITSLFTPERRSGAWRIENQVACPTAIGTWTCWTQAFWPTPWVLVIQEDPSSQLQAIVINDFLHDSTGVNWNVINVSVPLPVSALNINQYTGSTAQVRSVGGSWGAGTEDFDFTYRVFDSVGNVTNTGDLGNMGGVLNLFSWGNGSDLEVSGDAVRIDFHADLFTDGPGTGTETTSMLVYTIPIYDRPPVVVTDTCYGED
jgi:hypothetical protein